MYQLELDGLDRFERDLIRLSNAIMHYEQLFELLDYRCESDSFWGFEEEEPDSKPLGAMQESFTHAFIDAQTSFEHCVPLVRSSPVHFNGVVGTSYAECFLRATFSVASLVDFGEIQDGNHTFTGFRLTKSYGARRSRFRTIFWQRNGLAHICSDYQVTPREILESAAICEIHEARRRIEAFVLRCSTDNKPSNIRTTETILYDKPSDSEEIHTELVLPNDSVHPTRCILESLAMNEPQTAEELAKSALGHENKSGTFTRACKTLVACGAIRSAGRGCKSDGYRLTDIGRSMLNGKG